MSHTFYEIALKLLRSDFSKVKKSFSVGVALTVYSSVSFVGYCSEQSYVATSPETPLGYYQCIDGACSMRNVLWKPSIKSHELLMSPVKNQNPLGTCTSFAVGACVEKATFHNGHDRKLYYNPVSEAEFTVYAEQNTVGGDCRQGLNLGEALEAATKRGFIEESHWPYYEYLQDIRGLNKMSQKDDFDDLTNICARHKYTDRQLSSFAKFKLNGFELLSHIARDEVTSAVFKEVHRTPDRSSNRNRPLHVDSIRSESSIDLTMKAFLQNNKPIAVSVPTFNSWNDRGDIDMPTLTMAKRWKESKEKRALISRPRYTSSYAFEDHFVRLNLGLKSEEDDNEGWHAVVITGYSDQRQAFKFKNSWGSDWGYAGYGWLPYQYVAQYASEIVATH